MSPSPIAVEYARLLAFSPSEANAVAAWSIAALFLCAAFPAGLVWMLRRAARANEDALAKGLIMRRLQNAEALQAGRRGRANTLIMRCSGDRRKLAELIVARPWIKDYLAESLRAKGGSRGDRGPSARDGI